MVSYTSWLATCRVVKYILPKLHALYQTYQKHEQLSDSWHIMQISEQQFRVVKGKRMTFLDEEHETAAEYSQWADYPSSVLIKRVIDNAVGDDKIKKCEISKYFFSTLLPLANRISSKANLVWNLNMGVAGNNTLGFASDITFKRSSTAWCLGNTMACGIKA